MSTENIISFPEGGRRIRTLVEGNPNLIWDHPVILSKGALVYYMHTPVPCVDLVLSAPRLDLPTLYKESEPFDAWWARLNHALAEVNELGTYPKGLPPPTVALRVARDYFVNSKLRDELLKDGQQVRLCFRRTAPLEMEGHKRAPGWVNYTPDFGWNFEVCADEHHDNYPGKEE